MRPIREWPAFGKSAFFFGCIALVTVVERFFHYLSRGQAIGPVFTWADVRYYVGIWVIFTAIYYVGWAVWYRWFRSTTPTEIIEIKSSSDSDGDAR